MAHSSWKEADKSLDQSTQPFSEAQRALAKRIGKNLDEGTPGIVAGALLRTALATELKLPAAAEISEYHTSELEWLRQYATSTISPANDDEAHAWVDFLRLVRRRGCLKDLELTSGDVVRTILSDCLEEVASIGGDGRVYLKGGKSRGVWPDQIVKVEARASDDTDLARVAKVDAQNAAASRKASAKWSDARSQDLQEVSTAGQLQRSEISELEAVIAAAPDERPIQKYLQEHQHMLTALLGGKERFCMPQKRLGSEFVPDFIIGDVDSLGIRWTLVELETPDSGLYLTDGSSWDKYARKGVSQIVQWRNWLKGNLAYAHKPLRDNGLGLHNIDGDALALVLVGRRGRMPSEPNEAERIELRRKSMIDVHTYDWLIERLESILGFRGPPACNPYLVRKDDPAVNEGYEDV
jgi:hypothetical protein